VAPQRNVPGAPATRYLRISLCCPISALAKSSSMSSLTSCAGTVKYSTPRPKDASLEVQPSLLVVRLDDDVGEDRGRNGELGPDDETLGVLLLLLHEFDLAEP